MDSQIRWLEFYRYTAVRPFGNMPSFTRYEPKVNVGKGTHPFTGYEPNNFVGQEKPENVPISLEPAASGSHPSSIRAWGNPLQQGRTVEAALPIQAGSVSNPAVATLVQADFTDTLASDLGGMMDTSLISVEDFLAAEPIVPVQQQQSPSQHPSGGQPTASIVTNVPSSTTSEGQPTASSVTNEANEVQKLRQEVEAFRSHLHETRIIAKNYAEHVKARSHLKAEEALHYQEDTFEKRAEDIFTARDICRSEVAQSNAVLETDAVSVIREQNEKLNNASNIVTNLRQHLTHAQQVATKEADERRHSESESTAALDAQRATSLLEQSKLRIR